MGEKGEAWRETRETKDDGQVEKEGTREATWTSKALKTTTRRKIKRYIKK